MNQPMNQPANQPAQQSGPRQPAGDQLANRDRRRALALLAWLPALLLAVNLAAVAALPHSAWGDATTLLPRDQVQRVLPQGWAFFTRDPQEPRIQAYGKPDGQWTSLGTGPTSGARWAFGLNRGARLLGIEMGMVLHGLSAQDWVECERGAHADCLDSLTPVAGPAVDNPSPRPRLCGTVGLVRQEIVPWAWRASADSVQMPLSGVVVEVKCPQR